MMGRFITLICLICCYSLYGNQHKKLILAIDGLAKSSFDLAQSKNIFRQFSGTAHVAPYPSMTEVSWTEIMHTKDLFPLRGDVQTVEATSFDIDTLLTVDDPRTMFIRYARPTSYFSAFDASLNPIIESLIYLDLKNEPIINQELKDLERDIKEQFKGDHFIAYVSSVDAVAHTRKDALYPLLVQIDEMLKRIEDYYRSKKVDLEVWIVSDHGNVGRFSEGEEEKFLNIIDLEEMVNKTSFKFKKEKEKPLTDPYEIAVPIMALGNYAGVYFFDLSKREEFALAMLKNREVQLITYVEKDGTTVILGRNGEIAQLLYNPKLKKYLYNGIAGNPLDVKRDYIGRWLSEDDLKKINQEEQALSSSYPDALYRLVQVAQKQVYNEPDLIINFKDGYCVKGGFSNWVKMVRTHGSLSSKSSLGVVAVSNNVLKEQDIKKIKMIRSEDILSYMEVEPEEALHQSHHFFHQDPHKAILNAPKTVPTKVNDFSSNTLFLRITKILAKTYNYSTKSHAVEHVHFISEIYNRLKEVPLNSDFKSKFELEKIKELLGELLEDPLNKGEKVADDLVKHLNWQEELSNKTTNIDEESIGKAIALIRDLYTLPYALDKLFVQSDKNSVNDGRDRTFSLSWFDKIKSEYKQNPGLFEKNPENIQKLFKEVLYERKLLDEVHPNSFPLFYNPQSEPVTIVFVPGIYNEIFSQEIFNDGINALKNNLGMRVIYADVDGRCSSLYNGKKIIEFLKEDRKKQKERGYPNPSYFIFGYSKGGVDSLYALLEDEQFARKNVWGLLTIASPLRGISIGQESEVFQKIVKKVTRPLPDACQSFSPSKELSPGERATFFENNRDRLSGLTRFYSISFKSIVDFDGFSSNFIMDILKQIYYMPFENDGLVTEENSQFPSEISSLHLGSLLGHHLAGLRSTNLRQGPFMEAILLTLLELNAFNPLTQIHWYNDLGRYSEDPHLREDFYKRNWTSIMGPLSPVEKNWYSTIMVERALLAEEVDCNDFDILNQLPYRLHVKNINTRPIEFHCDNNILSMSITAHPGSWFPWKSAEIKKYYPKTLNDVFTKIIHEGFETPILPMSKPSFKYNHTLLKIPNNKLKWTKERRISPIKDANTLNDPELVTPLTPQQGISSIDIICDHPTIVDFRKEFNFFYEDSSPSTSSLDDKDEGYSIVMDEQLKDWACKLTSHANSTRLTTAALRFNIGDYPLMDLKLKSMTNPTGANSIKEEGPYELDRTPFEVWLTFHKLGDNSAKGLRQLGFYWGDQELVNKAVGEYPVMENKYSEYNYWVVTLPPAWFTYINTPQSQLGIWTERTFDLRSLIKRSYPNYKDEEISQMEVILITFQTDMRNLDLHDSTLYFKNLKIHR